MNVERLSTRHTLRTSQTGHSTTQQCPTPGTARRTQLVATPPRRLNPSPAALQAPRPRCRGREHPARAATHAPPQEPGLWAGQVRTPQTLGPGGRDESGGDAGAEDGLWTLPAPEEPEFTSVVQLGRFGGPACLWSAQKTALPSFGGLVDCAGLPRVAYRSVLLQRALGDGPRTTDPNHQPGLHPAWCGYCPSLSPER